VIAALDAVADAHARLAIGAEAEAYRAATESALAAAIAFGFLQRRYFRNADHALRELPALARVQSAASLTADLASLDANRYIGGVAAVVVRLHESARERRVELDTPSLERLVGSR
jgi:hypothetical protein